jgi:acid phosphatase
MVLALPGNIVGMRILAGVTLLLALCVPATASAAGRMDRIKHIVVIYEENHSFDNLYGGWPRVDGVDDAPAARTRQVDQAGKPYTCLQQNDVNLATHPCSTFPNRPFVIDDFIPPTATTCPAPGQSAPNGVLNGTGQPGGCTRDLVHRFYQEQYQLNDGKQNRYVTGSDAIGLTMGVYRTGRLPIYRYLHRSGAPRYVIADRFFQAAFGGSFLNHQWLVAARTPTWPNAPADQHSVVDANGMPNTYPLYTPTIPTVADKPLTVACPAPSGVVCGDFAVNTIQPTYQPHGGGSQLPPQTHKTIGDRLSAKGVSWAWYSGGWSNANGDVDAPGWTNGSGPTCSDPNASSSAVYPNCPDKLFQFHHQPLNYFASFAPGTKERTRHLRDEAEFIARARASKRSCKLRKVSFVKPVGAENEHPGYASVSHGSDHLVTLLRAIRRQGCRKNTMIVVTYDEFGGQWDHVPPPGQGGSSGVHDEMGPGTRIPALVLAPGLRHRFAVDHTKHDTTSVLATIERRFHVRALTSRDRKVRDLGTVFRARR